MSRFKRFNKQRLQFDFSPYGIRQLDELQKRLDAPSRAEVIRRAINFLDYATSSGGKIILKCDDKEETLVVV